MSDWFGTHSTAALAAGLDLEMPGPAERARPPPAGRRRGGRGHRRGDRAGRAAGARPHRSHRARPGRAGRDEATPTDAAAIARAAATEAIVLLANDGVLPLDLAAGPPIAVIGWRADQPEIQGGGSAQVTPPYVITPLQGISRPRRRRAPSPSRPGGSRPGPRRSAVACWRPRRCAGRGRAVDYFAGRRPRGSAAPHGDPARETTAVWIGEPAPGIPAGDFSARLTAAFAPDVSGPWTLSVSGVGTARLFLDGEPLADTTARPSGAGLLGLFTHRSSPRSRSTPARPTRWSPSSTRHRPTARSRWPASPSRPAHPPQPDAVDSAVPAAAGRRRRRRRRRPGRPRDRGPWTPPRWTCPPTRSTLIRAGRRRQPPHGRGRQHRLARDDGLGRRRRRDRPDVVPGPGDGRRARRRAVRRRRRLRPPDDHPSRAGSRTPPPTPTSPAATAPSTYAEGIFVGYRHYDTSGVEPAGASATACRTRRSPTRRSPSSRDRPDGADGPCVAVSVDVTNTGHRSGSEVVQVYVRPLDAGGPPARPRAQGVREGHARPGRDDHRDGRPRPAGLRLLGRSPPRLACPVGNLRDPGRFVVPGDPPDGPLGVAG